MDHSELIPSPLAGVLGCITGEGLAGLREVTGLRDSSPLACYPVGVCYNTIPIPCYRAPFAYIKQSLRSERTELEPNVAVAKAKVVEDFTN
jgi:hypothetical protein